MSRRRCRSASPNLEAQKRFRFSPFTTFPQNLAIEVFQLLDIRSTLRLASTCRRLKNIFEHHLSLCVKRLSDLHLTVHFNSNGGDEVASFTVFNNRNDNPHKRHCFVEEFDFNAVHNGFVTINQQTISLPLKLNKVGFKALISRAMPKGDSTRHLLNHFMKWYDFNELETDSASDEMMDAIAECFSRHHMTLERWSAINMADNSFAPSDTAINRLIRESECLEFVCRMEPMPRFNFLFFDTVWGLNELQIIPVKDTDVTCCMTVDVLKTWKPRRLEILIASNLKADEMIEVLKEEINDGSRTFDFRFWVKIDFYKAVTESLQRHTERKCWRGVGNFSVNDFSFETADGKVMAIRSMSEQDPYCEMMISKF